MQDTRRNGTRETLQEAVAYHQAGRLEEAERLYHKILAREPENADALHLLGLIAHRRGRHDEALRLIGRAIALKPLVPTYHRDLGEVHLARGDFARAEMHQREALRLSPNFAEAHQGLAKCLRRQGKPEKALASYRRALALKPELTEALTGLAFLLDSRGERLEAESHYRRALALEPGDFMALVNLGNILAGRDPAEEAIALYREATKVRPRSVEALVNLGNALTKAGDLKEAVACYERALVVEPESAIVHNNLGNLLKDRGSIDRAIACYRKAIGFDPNFAMAHSNLLLAIHYSGDYDRARIFAEHQRWAETWARPLAQAIRPHPGDPSPARRLRVGYLSPDFWTHSVAFFTEPVLAAHDRSGFEIVCYANGGAEDGTTERLRKLADGWREISRLSDEEAEALIRRDRIDILVDLAGHTAGNRILVFARKPAPVQVSYLGYPNTTGLSTIDYRITDAEADPEGDAEAYHTERLVRLPRGFHCFAPPASCPDVGPLPARKGKGVTFASFNNLAKASPDVLSHWAAILRALPDSRLICKSRALGDRRTSEGFRAFFQRRGVARERIETLGRTPSQVQHLGLYNRVDIALDTYPYNGVTTSCEALWMGVPVVTLAGKTHASRVGASLLTTLGLKDLIARRPGDYVASALALAGDVGRLEKLRKQLRALMEGSALTDAAGFTRSLEAAYREMWRRWCREQNPPGQPRNS